MYNDLLHATCMHTELVISQLPMKQWRSNGL